MTGFGLALDTPGEIFIVIGGGENGRGFDVDVRMICILGRICRCRGICWEYRGERWEVGERLWNSFRGV